MWKGMYREKKMPRTFVPDGNQSPFQTTAPVLIEVVRDLEWFTMRLRERLTCHMEITWGNHVGYYYEVSQYGTEVMDSYLQYREKLFHNDALVHALRE